MTDRELMQQALEALENTTPTGFNMESDKKFYSAINALRERLARQEQEPVAWMDGYRNLYSLEEKAAGCPDAAIPLYTAPQPAREWRGLARLEFEKAVEGLEDLEDCWIAIENALREKNT